MDSRFARWFCCAVCVSGIRLLGKLRQTRKKRTDNGRPTTIPWATTIRATTISALARAKFVYQLFLGSRMLEGLIPISGDSPDIKPASVHPGMAGVIAHCGGNGECGLGENYCNCRQIAIGQTDDTVSMTAPMMTQHHQSQRIRTTARATAAAGDDDSVVVFSDNFNNDAVDQPPPAPWEWDTHIHGSVLVRGSAGAKAE